MRVVVSVLTAVGLVACGPGEVTVDPSIGEASSNPFALAQARLENKKKESPAEVANVGIPFYGNARDRPPLAQIGGCKVYATAWSSNPHQTPLKYLANALAEGDCREACKQFGTSGEYRSYQYYQFSGWTQHLWFIDDFYLRYDIPDKAALCEVTSYTNDFRTSVSAGSNYQVRNAGWEVNY